MHNLRPLRKLNKANISIQGSEHHYSIPRAYLDNLEDYKALEIALFTKNNVWINPRKSIIMRSYPNLQELLEYYEEDNNPVGHYVPLHLVMDLIKWLNKGE